MIIGQGSSKNNLHLKGQACCVHYHQTLQQLNDPLQSISNNHEFKQKPRRGWSYRYIASAALAYGKAEVLPRSKPTRF